MTNKQTQDRAWVALPTAIREQAKYFYQHTECGSYSESLLEDLFGEHNLTSDAEPEEMVICTRKDVLDFYQEALTLIERGNRNNYLNDKLIGIGQKNILYTLFGFKCLPDESASKPASKPASKAEPKFKVGDKVRLNCAYDDGEVWDKIMHGRVATVKSHYVNNSRVTMYKFEEDIRDFGEHWLEPYTEPANGGSAYISPESESYLRKDSEEPNLIDSLKETQPNYNMEEKEHRNLSQETANCDKMEDKELNLCEILKDCSKGTELFSISVGKVYFDDVLNDDLKVLTTYVDMIGNKYRVAFFSNGKRNKTGLPDFYPSEELLKKYPLDAKKAWMEFVEANKPKRWRAELGDTFYCLRSSFSVCDQYENEDEDCDQAWANYNYFRTESLAQQAAEAVKKTLDEFHKSISNESQS